EIDAWDTKESPTQEASFQIRATDTELQPRPGVRSSELPIPDKVHTGLSANHQVWEKDLHRVEGIPVRPTRPSEDDSSSKVQSPFGFTYAANESGPTSQEGLQDNSGRVGNETQIQMGGGTPDSQILVSRINDEIHSAVGSYRLRDNGTGNVSNHCDLNGNCSSASVVAVSNKSVALDIETDGLFDNGDAPNIISWASSDGRFEWGMKGLKEFVEAQVHPLIFHNAGFDVAVMRSYGIEVKAFHDTQIMAYVLNPTLPNSLENSCLEYGIPNQKLAFPWGKRDPTQQEINDNLDLIQKRNTTDTSMTQQLYDKLELFLHEQGLWEHYSKVELPHAEVIMTMEKNGIVIDNGTLPSTMQELKTRINELRQLVLTKYPTVPLGKKIYKKEHEEYSGYPVDKIGGTFVYTSLPIPTNPNSDDHRVWILEHEGVKLTKETPGGKRSVESRVLEILDSPTAKIFLELEQLTKLVGGFLEPFTDYRGNDGRIHAQFN
ncbi:MAG: hypothetical protein ACRDEA_10495, partial [Microcystaceae cyanobacterium]